MRGVNRASREGRRNQCGRAASKNRKTRGTLRFFRFVYVSRACSRNSFADRGAAGSAICA